MTFNNFGEITSTEDRKRRELTPSENLTLLCQDALSSGNVLPHGMKLEDGATLYYKSHHIQEIKDLLEQIKKLSTENNVLNLLNHDDTVGMSVEEAVIQIQKNIDFSEKITQELKDNPIMESSVDESKSNDLRQKLKDKLMGKKE